MSNLKIYNEYKKFGVENYYKKYSNSYFNPHEDNLIKDFESIIKLIILRQNNNFKNNLSILDIACGDGLVSKIINNNLKDNNLKNKIIIEGTDPYFFNEYCTYNYSFQDIAKGVMNFKQYDIGICCYAFHLMDKSWYYQFFNELANIVNEFIIITPSKKININHNLWKVIKNYRTTNKITIIILKNNKS